MSLAAYRALLGEATSAGYEVVALDEWLEQEPDGRRVLVLRHDVDQQPAAALRMARIEEELGVRATWYFRWRTAHPGVVRSIARTGATVGLHYETLSRTARAEGLRTPTDELIARCRETLRREVAAFRDRFGEIRTICPHGDTRAPGIGNHLLVRDVDPAEFGVAFDGNEVMRGRWLGAWLTDRPGGTEWKDGANPAALFAAGATPLFAVVHPNNWTSRWHAGADRVLRRLFPDPRRPPWPIRSGTDEPPL